MLGTMYRFRLKLSTVGVYCANNGRKIAEVIPKGAELTTTDADVGDPSADRRKLIAVEWQGRPFAVFLVDLLDRGDQVRQAGG